MQCDWDQSLLRYGDQLPPELIEVLRSSSNEQYLSGITRAALDGRYTTILLAHCEPIFAHVCCNLRQHGSFTTSIATLGRIVPFAPLFAPYATELLQAEPGHLSRKPSDDERLQCLLAYYRLLSFDIRMFRGHVRASDISPLLLDGSKTIVYMAIRILQILLSGADHWFEQMIESHIGTDDEQPLDGMWDDGNIDYRFLALWEERRAKEYHDLTTYVSEARTLDQKSLRTLPEAMFDPSTALIGNSLFPSGAEPNSVASLVITRTVEKNLRAMAEALKSTRPMLLTGLPGCGKTSLTEFVANKLGKSQQMVTLHINEQSDAKLLIGIYTTGDTPGSFIWKPGVLTTAVQEGRWLCIEDLDRAPNDIIGTLLPLIEKGELSIPSRKQVLHSAEGFRIIATARTTLNHRGDEVRPLSSMVGARHWQTVHLDDNSLAELHQVAEQLYPDLKELLPRFVGVYERLQATKQHAVLAGRSKAGTIRSISSREFLKWCSRVQSLLSARTALASSDLDDIFMEAIDCFVGALPNGDARSYMTALIAEELHIDPQRRDFLLAERDIRYDVDNAAVMAGRYRLPRSVQSKKSKRSQSNFAITSHTSRMLERAAAAVVNREPLLLVGETGVGKTTAVQHLASDLGKKLEVFNLSQQSEAGDLLGGFKPVTPRGMMIPLKDEFDDLFQASFSRSKNQLFIDLLAKQMARSNWRAVCKLWQQALRMLEQRRHASPERDGEAPNKKRRIEQHALDLARWDAFAVKVSDVERRLQAGGSSFAFTFMEGNIVKAVRNGDWVLLDEINLASSDTLESIVDLLNPHGASLMLSEAGSVDRIKAHPEFRVFAAMNPATDVGKKDLPPGIRSRFTELYVESPDRDTKSLQSIVRSYLRTETAVDPTLAPDVSSLYQKIIGLAEANKLVDGTGQCPHFSLRTLTRTLAYAKHIAPQCNLRRALYEGFQMSFLTFLDQESAAVVEPLLMGHLFKQKSNVRAELQKALRKPEDGHRYVQGHPASKHWVRQGASSLEDQPHYILTPFIQNNMENLVRAASTRRFPVLIQGPTSSGKTSMIEYLARRTGHRFVRINNHEHTDLQEYLGTYISSADGKLVFQEGLLVKALREGHWIVLDELNLAPTDVLEALNRLLDDNRELLIPETQETVRPHEDFMLFATQNPAGLYGGRKALSRAFRNRFLELHFDDIPIDELQEILHRRTQLPESRCKRIVTVYRELSLLRQENRIFESRSFATLRDLFRWALRPNDTIEDLAANGFMLLAERVRTDSERETLKGIIEKALSTNGPRVIINEALLYSATGQDIQKCRNVLDGDVVWTKAMCRLYILVSRAITNNEPVLLVGETGCGKTTVCQMLADALGKQLHTINAHQNTETGDLIGSQRPVRNRGMIETDLRDLLMSTPDLGDIDSLQQQPTQVLLDAFDRAVATLPEPELAEYQASQHYAEVLRLRTRFNALFEWADGSLVQAMKEGSFFLLDEISLADDSVLERLNSVLESERSILLAEKGSVDAFVQAKPGFQFFATMNPGGDYGKRELSPALRNRFTEIWVPALSDQGDMAQIVEAKLVDRAKPLSGVLVNFAQWFRDAYNTSASSSVSLRDLLAWVNFINVSSGLDLAAACIHGAGLVYIDTLGANPAGLMALTGRSLDEDRADCMSKLSDLIQLDAATVGQGALTVSLTASVFSIGNFAAARRAGDHGNAVSFTFDAPTSRLNAMRVLRAMQLSKPVMLEGSPGVGKTALITAIAAALNIPLVRINLSEQTDMMDLLGSDTPVEGSSSGSFSWRDAPFLRAMKRGDWVLLDEMNLASQSVLEGLNACLDHRGEVYIPELGQSFSKHSDFRLFAAQNPHHQGGGRKGLPASFVNRFTVVYANSFHMDDMVFICRQLFPAADDQLIEEAARFVTALERSTSKGGAFSSNGGPWEFNLRDISRWLLLATHASIPLAAGSIVDFIDLLFLQRFRTSQDREHGRAVIRAEFSASGTITTLASTLSSRHLQLGLALLPRHPHTLHTRMIAPWTARSSQHLRTLQAAMIAVQQTWPVVLVGPSGVGKTALLEHLAATVGASLTTISINADTDATDLIGGYEQSDSGRQLVKSCRSLVQQLQSNLKVSLLSKTEPSSNLNLFSHLQHVEPTSSRTDIEQLLSMLQAYKSAEADSTLQAAQQALQSIDQGRFEWLDGHLIEALEQGSWVVLDNANLCSGAVLDRLNSLLEPNGVLIVNEKSEPDGSPRCIRPHPDFRIFLTVDPRYGELSRAIRNRSVELYMDADGEASPSLQPLAQESRMARFRGLASLSSMRLNEPTSSTATQIIQEHTALVDQPLVTRFLTQIQLGLVEQTQETGQLRFPSGISATNVSRMRELYTAAVGHKQDMADFIDAQTLHPLNNQAIVQPQPQIMQHAFFLSSFLEVSFLWHGLLASLGTASSNPKLQQKISRIERALTRTNRSGSSNGLVASLIATLKLMLQGLSAMDFNSIQQVSRLRAHFNDAGAMVACFVSAIQQPSADVTTLQAWLSVMWDILSRILDDQSAASPVFHHLVRYISTFRADSQHLRGSGMSTLWRALRPATCSTMEQLGHLLEFEQLIDEFDEVCRRHEMPLSTLSELRSSFAGVLQAAAHGQSDVQQLSEHLKSLLAQIVQGEGFAIPKKPHFQASFERLCCRLALCGSSVLSISTQQFSMLEILAGRSTKLNISQAARREQGGWRLGDLGILLPAVSMEADQTGELHADFVQLLLSRLNSIQGVVLDHLDLLQSEKEVLGQTMAISADDLCKGETGKLQQLLQALLTQVLSTLASSTTAIVAKEASIMLEMLDMSDGADERFNQCAIQNLPGLFNAALYCRKEAGSSEDDLKIAASAWLSFATECLMLYLPTQAFDPALGPHLRCEVYRYSFNRLTDQKTTLRRMQRIWTGEQDTLRTRVLEHDIAQLGPEPVADAVCRPMVSELVRLQAEFDSLSRSLSHPVGQPSKGDDSGWSSSVRTNILEVRQRLDRQYRAYADITGPAVGFIDCLRISWQLQDQAQALMAAKKEGQSVSTLTPFVTAEAATWLSDDKFVEVLKESLSSQERLFTLSLLGTRTAINNEAPKSRALRDSINQQFVWFYDQWQKRLSQDQKATAAKSSLYRYQGEEDAIEDDSDEAIEQLFPGHVAADGETQVPPLSRPQDFTIGLSEAHHAIFNEVSGYQASATALLNNLSKISSSIGPEIQSAIPCLLALMQEMSDAPHQETSASHLYDMYTDSNIVEVKRLAKLLRTIHHRFSELHTAWPEHATPIEVHRHCQQILAYAHTEPLTKFFPPLEKLHGTIAEWQKVASREYSAAGLYDDVTDLIVSWRQIELSSWAGLLARESDSCVKCAKSWWFVAFETIIAASHVLRDSPSELEQHTQGLLATLETFILGCGLGEYAPRLQILRDFQAHLESDSADYPSLRLVFDALTNFISYFERFTAEVEDALSKGRAALEKEIRNVVQVASWKDRNVEILRQSAKSSHKKLLRLVRKFRVLLARPVAPIIQSSTPQLQQLKDKTSTRNDALGSLAVRDMRAIQHISIWNSRPARYQNVQATASLLESYVTRSMKQHKADQRVSTFVSELLSDIRELQRATPTTITEENKTVVQHLKTRKRRLLADVLKETRNMGFKTNLSDSIIAKQTSRAVVLARLPALPTRSEQLAVDVGELHLHRLLSIMPQVREDARKHSEDLTPAEAVRCLTILESMLALLINIRTKLAQHLYTTDQLSKTMQQFHAFAFCVGPTPAHPSASSLVQRIRSTVYWLETSIELVKYQGDLAHRDYSTVSGTLQTCSTNFRTVCQDYDARPSLPLSITNDHLVSMRSRYVDEMEHLAQTLQHSITEHPELQPVLNQLKSWCQMPQMNETYTNGASSTAIEDWVTGLFAVLDQALAAVQQTQDIERTVTRGDPETSWLVQEQLLLERQLHSMHPVRVSQSLQKVLDQLHTLRGADTLQLAVAACHAQLPIAEAFANGVTKVLSKYAGLYAQVSNMASELAKSFSTIAQRGFCTPTEKSDSKDKDSGQVEAGTGLGDGEGAEDVSKDVKDDEDLSELAQSAEKKQDGEDIENEKDAVDMADDELEGEMDEGEAKDEDGEGSDEEDADGAEMDEEAGNVDDLGPSTVDEKMWEEPKSDELREKEGDRAEGKSKEEDLAAAEQDSKDAPKEGEVEEDVGGEEAADEENEEVGRQEMEKMDPHVQDQDNLDLPEDMNMDADTQDKDDLSEIGSVADEMDEKGDQLAEDQETMGDDEPDSASAASDEIFQDAEETQEAEQQTHGEDDANEDAQSDVLMQNDVDEDMKDLDDDVVGETGSAPNKEPEGKDSNKATAPQQVEQDEEDGTSANEPESGGTGGRGQRKGDQGGEKDQQEDQTSLPYKQIGDALEEWYKQYRPIEAAQAEEDGESQPKEQDIDMTDAEFEHLPNDNAKADTQVLGAATAEQSTALDEDNGLSVNEDQQPDERPAMDDAKEEDETMQEDGAQGQAGTKDAPQRDAGPKAFVGEVSTANMDADMQDAPERSDDESDRVEDVDERLTNTHLTSKEDIPAVSMEEARLLWATHEASTRSLALVLTEHLRLILQPTQATKMRGDFRTGKRLNIKRIIPYIASSYKRDKIWMRRSVPSKRAYQIMLAIDDSQSMSESNSRNLAFETLTLVAKSLSMLEVGELSVVRFGNTTNVAHDFSTPLTSESGANIIQQFTFNQSKTDVRKLLTESIDLFRSARLKAAGSASDLWQLQLIISDGVCEDHASIRQLVRQAHEERIMVVFIIVDMVSAEENTTKKQSIIDLQTAEFVKDVATGEMELKMVKYLDTFPFRYYLIVRDVQELPGVLAGALRQWFAEVVDTA